MCRPIFINISLFLFFTLSGVRWQVLPETFSPPHLLVFSTLLCLLSSSSLPPQTPAFFTYIFKQSSHLRLGLPRLLLPCSRNSAALFGSLSSAIVSTCQAHCSLLLTSLCVRLLCTPVSSPLFACLPLLLLLFFGPSCFRTLAAFIVVVRSAAPRFPFRTGMPV